MQKNELIKVEITDVNNLGCGVGHLQNAGERTGQTVFVKGAVTGEEIEGRVIKVAKSYLVARTEKILKPSAHRITEDVCRASAACGGCAYRHITYEHELELKRGYVQAAFRKAGLPDVTVENVRSTYELTGYRNKAQYPFAKAKDGRVTAGFFATNTHRVVEAKNCALQPLLFGEILSYFCEFADRYGISVYDEESGKGLLRHLYLRMGKVSGEVMVCPVINGDRLPHEDILVRELTERFPMMTCLTVNTNTENTNVVLGEKYRLLYGRAWIEDTLCGLNFRITPQSFYQVNHDACELLYGLAKERACLTGKELLLDLYCGIGSIGLSMARDAREVLGMEIVESAARAADENAKRNGIENASFFCGDAGDPNGLLRRAEQERGDLTDAVVIIDPPRKGTTRELIEGITERNIRRVVYVSCNPDTLARDCAIFREFGYEIGTVTPVDLFPKTGHVESVVCLTRSDKAT
jgi:23S rRNA (uracil1939-C5)-methyltransferase